jgi:hypothetical protein
MKTKFPLGQAFITGNALDKRDPDDVLRAIVRHASGDWGEVCDEDKRINDQGLEHGTRVLSAYTDRNGVKFWVITEAERSVTTILLPDDY